MDQRGVRLSPPDESKAAAAPQSGQVTICFAQHGVVFVEVADQVAGFPPHHVCLLGFQEGRGGFQTKTDEFLDSVP